MKKGILTLLLTGMLLCSFNVSAQVTHIYNGMVLNRLFEKLRTTADDAGKQAFSDSIKSIIRDYSKSDSVFAHRFTDVRFLGQVTSPDSLLKIISWNVVTETGGFYNMFIIHRNSPGEKATVTEVTAPYSEKVPENRQYSADDWYGALYYDARPFASAGKTLYILLGIDYGNSIITRKIIDVLGFSQDGKPLLGFPVFASEKGLLNRVLFQYSSAAVMSLKFESNTMIVFDHLSPFSPEFTGNYRYYGPDFSFDSFNFEKGNWYLKQDIDIKNK